MSKGIILPDRKPAIGVVAVTMLVIIIIGACLANPARSVHFLNAGGVNFWPENIDAATSGTMTAGARVMDFSAVKATEIIDFIKELRVEKTAVAAGPGQVGDNQILLAYLGSGPEGSVDDNNVYLNFNEDFSLIWAGNETKRSPSYRVKRPEEVRAFFERQFGSTAPALSAAPIEELWQARTEYIGDNSAVGKLLGLMPLPECLRHNSFRLHTVGAERGLEWILDEAEDASYQVEQFDRAALLLFALIGNMEDFYVTTKDPWGGGTKLHYDRMWANKEAGGDSGDIRDRAQSPEVLLGLLDLAGRQEIDSGISRLTITTPRDLFSPAMSSMFGFELLLDAPGDPASYTYVCTAGSFCTYKEAEITHKGNNLTTAKKVYWLPLEGNAYFYPGGTDIIRISVTALDEQGKATACGTAFVESLPEGGWFKFIGEITAGCSSGEAFGACDPVQVIKDELAAGGFQIIDVREYGERHMEHSTYRTPAGSKTEDNEVATVFAAYLDKGGNALLMNYTMRRPAGDKAARWVYGDPIPWVDPRGRLELPEEPTSADLPPLPVTFLIEGAVN